jgi:hypothetical protein
MLIALKHPSDEEKVNIAREELKKRQSKWYKMKNEFVPPVEWLNPKERDIESINCLLHHGDLLKDPDFSPHERAGSIEACLSQKDITRWEGQVIRSNGQCTIKFQDHFLVRFGNVQATMPLEDKKVNFCLSFDMFGLSAWRVMRVVETKYDYDCSNTRDDDSSSDYSEPEDMQDEHYRAGPSLSSIGISQYDEKQSRNACESRQPQDEGVVEKRCKWDEENKQVVQERIPYTNPVNGFCFEGSIAKDMVLNFKVGTSSERTRTVDVPVLKVRKYKSNCFLSDGGRYKIQNFSNLLKLP